MNRTVLGYTIQQLPVRAEPPPDLEAGKHPGMTTRWFICITRADNERAQAITVDRAGRDEGYATAIDALDDLALVIEPPA